MVISDPVSVIKCRNSISISNIRTDNRGWPGGTGRLGIRLGVIIDTVWIEVNLHAGARLTDYGMLGV